MFRFRTQPFRRCVQTISREPFYVIPGANPVICTAEQAVECVQSGNRVFMHGGGATPNSLIHALGARAARNEFEGVEVVGMLMAGIGQYATPELQKALRVNSFLLGSSLRQPVRHGLADYTPVFLRNVPRLFTTGYLPIDVAFISTSPPDNHGYCSLGPSVDIARAALQSAKMVIAFVNKKMPRTFGDGLVHMSHFKYMVEGDADLAGLESRKDKDVDRVIAKYVSDYLIEDGATLATGLGTLPNAVLGEIASSRSHRNLGFHSEVCSDSFESLIQSGVVTNALKKVQPGQSVVSLAIGNPELYSFLHNNPAVAFRESAFTNDPALIATNPKVTTINSAIEVDLTGQIVSSTIGPLVYSGIGGHQDFALGALMCPGGKAVTVLPSRTDSGLPRVVSKITTGAAVSVSREHAQFIVTEHGIADLFGKTVESRVREMLKIAHPADRERLEYEYRKMVREGKAAKGE